MMILLSCAKTMENKSSYVMPVTTLPQFRKEASDIIFQLAQYPVDKLMKILKVPVNIAAENHLRYMDFHSNETLSLPALQAYTGIVFKNIKPEDFSKDDLIYAQEHLRITSFCYGLLRPTDKIKLYRLEGDVVLPEYGDITMFEFWKKRLTEPFLKEIGKNGNILFNLASNEMKQLFDWKKIDKTASVITPQFKIWKNGKLTTIVIYTKMARGAMTRYILKNKIENPEELKNFSWEGFSFREDLSDEKQYTFIQE